MKKIKFYNPLLVMIFGIFIALNFISCEEDEIVYTNQYIINGDIGLTYTGLTTYPYQTKIKSDTPDYNISTSVYRFNIIEVRLSDGSTANLNNFSIDIKTGVIIIDNSNGNIIPGETYNFDIGVENVNGIIREDNTFILKVLEIPLDYTITNETAEVNFLKNADVATIAYVDTSTGGAISDVTYTLDNAPTGFTIDSDTGVISKNTEASSGVHLISVIIQTNLGSITFADVLTVTVGDAPVIQYVQADGATVLSKTVLSPWTAYTTAIPKLEGMNPVKFEIILPATLAAGSVIANDDGTIYVSENQDLALGEHILGVIATNSSDISATFENIFTLSIEAHWDATPVFTENFNNAVPTEVTPNEYNAVLNSYKLNSSEIDFVVQHTDGKGDVFTAKISDPKIDGAFPANIDAGLVLELTMQPEWRKMRISFTEGFGFGDDRLDWFERSLLSSHSIADIQASAFDINNWNTVMEINDPSWSGSSVWKTLSSDADLTQIPFKDVEITPGNSTIYLNWRIKKTAIPTKGAAFLIDDIRVEVSKAFAAAEF